MNKLEKIASIIHLSSYIGIFIIVYWITNNNNSGISFANVLALIGLCILITVTILTFVYLLISFIKSIKEKDKQVK